MGLIVEFRKKGCDEFTTQWRAIDRFIANRYFQAVRFEFPWKEIIINDKSVNKLFKKNFPSQMKVGKSWKTYTIYIIIINIIYIKIIIIYSYNSTLVENQSK